MTEKLQNGREHHHCAAPKGPAGGVHSGWPHKKRIVQTAPAPWGRTDITSHLAKVCYVPPDLQAQLPDGKEHEEAHQSLHSLTSLKPSTTPPLRGGTQRHSAKPRPAHNPCPQAPAASAVAFTPPFQLSSEASPLSGAPLSLLQA